VARIAVCLAVFAVLLVEGAAGATAPTLAISATGVLGDSDTIVIAVSNPSSRVEIEIPEGYAFPQPGPSAGHAFIRFADGSGGGRGVVSVLRTPPAATCARGTPDQVWDAGFDTTRVFVFLAARVMTICPLPAQTTEIVIASKYWSTPREPGAYEWRATTADGASATATIRLPVRLTLAQTARRPKVRLRARLTENGAPLPGALVQLVGGGGRSLTTARTRADGSAAFTLGIRRKTVVYAVTALGADAGEPHTLQSNRLTVRTS
jgi:hypothetical protein